MIVDSNSRSLILRATHILHITVVTADEHPWHPREGGGEERSIALGLRLEEVFKGSARQPPGSPLHLEVQQVRLGEAWGPMPGAWSNVSTEEGTSIISFASSDSLDAEVLCRDPASVQLLSAEDALADVRLAVRTSSLSLTETIATARAEASTLGNLFADYLWAVYQSEALGDFPVFDAILSVMEWPELGPVARSTLLMSIPDLVLNVEPLATRHVDRLAVSMVRMLSIPSAHTQHQNILSTFLPNLVEAERSTSRPAAEVFSAYPAERTSLADAIEARSPDPSVAVLARWMQR